MKHCQTCGGCLMAEQSAETLTLRETDWYCMLCQRPDKPPAVVPVPQPLRAPRPRRRPATLTECSRGHPFPENLIISSNGTRRCLACCRTSAVNMRAARPLGRY